MGARPRQIRISAGMEPYVLRLSCGSFWQRMGMHPIAPSSSGAGGNRAVTRRAR